MGGIGLLLVGGLLGGLPASHADHYSTLGVPRNAKSDEIRTAYRKLALRHHPDKKGGAADASERFQRIQEAYEVLGDAQKRRLYDMHGHHDPRAQHGFGSAGGYGGGFGFGGGAYPGFAQPGGFGYPGFSYGGWP